MKSAVLLVLFAPVPAFAAVIARPAGSTGVSVAPVRLQSPVLFGAPGLTLHAAPSLTPSLSVAPAARIAPAVAAAVAVAAPVALTPAALAVKATPNAPQAAASPRALTAARTMAASLPEGPSLPGHAWDDAGRLFDGSRRLYANESAKVEATLRYGAAGSAVFASLNNEFRAQGGYFVLDRNTGAKYLAAAALDQDRRPVIILTHDLLNRYNGRSEDSYRGAPWEFIASVIAREQVFFNPWYGAIPASAEKLAASFMNMTRVFVDLTNGTSRSWATDKDYQAVAGDRSSYTQWNWFEQLVAASRAAAAGVGTNAGHLIESKFFSWVRDWTAPQEKASVPAFQYSLWEQYDGHYYRPGDAKNGQPLPPGAPRIDKTTYDRAAQTAYGADGKGSAATGGLDANSAYGWIIQWLKSRFEI